VDDLGDERVLEVTSGPSGTLPAPGEAAAARFAPGLIEVVLPGPRRVGRVVFELSDAPWVARPSVHASLDGASWEPVDATASLADATLSLYRDPRRGRGEVRFAPRTVLALRLDPRLPVRPGPLETGE
jgi:hypothetical protein